METVDLDLTPLNFSAFRSFSRLKFLKQVPLHFALEVAFELLAQRFFLST